MNLLPAARAAILLAAGGLAVAAVHQAVELAEERAELVRTALDLGLEDPRLLRMLERTEDPEGTRAILGRAILATALGEEQPRALRTRRLEAAERLARRALADRPTSWQAAMVTGAAPYTRWSLDRDPRLLQEYRRWEEPLALAVRLAPGQSEPVSYLAGAYLDLWPSLSDGKRERARELLAVAFEEPGTFQRLLGPWLEVSGSDLAPIPDEPWAWMGLQKALAARREWPAFCRAWALHRRNLHDRLVDQIAEGERLVATDRLLAGRRVLFQAAAAAPVDHRFAPLVDRALRAAPHGPGQNGASAPFGAWLEWALDLALHGEESRLSPEALARLRAVVMAGSDDPGRRAAAVWTYLAAGDHRSAGRSERRSGTRWSEPWAPYWIVKARLQIADGDPAEARRSLAEVHPAWQEHPAFRLARLALAEAEGTPALDPARIRDARARLAADRWSAGDWSWQGSRARLEALLADRGAGLAVALADVPPGGAALAVRWDGEVLGCHPAAEASTLRFRRPVEPGLHLLEIETLGSATGRVAPGAVRLIYPDEG